jgi:heme-degrading monooxygenase HmoA
MFARVSEVTAPADKMDEGIAQYNDVVLPQIRSMDGFVRTYLLVDRDAGRALSISVWDSAEAMAASEAAAGAMRDQVTDAMAGQSGVSRYEVVIQA